MRHFEAFFSLCMSFDKVGQTLIGALLRSSLGGPSNQAIPVLGTPTLNRKRKKIRKKGKHKGGDETETCHHHLSRINDFAFLTVLSGSWIRLGSKASFMPRFAAVI